MFYISKPSSKLLKTKKKAKRMHRETVLLDAEQIEHNLSTHLFSISLSSDVVFCYSILNDIFMETLYLHRYNLKLSNQVF